MDKITGLMKGDLNVGRRLEILRNVRRRLGYETVYEAVGGQKERMSKLLGQSMSVSDGKNDPVSDVRNTPFVGPNDNNAINIKVL